MHRFTNIVSFSIICLAGSVGLQGRSQSLIKEIVESAKPVIAAEESYLEITANLSEGKYEAALERLIPMAEWGMPVAQYLLGSCYANGSGVEQSFKLAEHWLRLSADQGQESARYLLALLLIENIDLEEGIRLMQDCHKNGSMRATEALGSLYLEGELVPQDVAKGMDFLKQAGASGSATAWYQIGQYFESRGSRSPDPRTYYLKAAQLSLPEACIKLGDMSAQGWLDAPINAEDALNFYLEAIRLKHTPAYFKVGTVYETGILGERNKQRALEWYEEGAKRGDVYALNRIGYMYLMGEGIEKDETTALKRFHEAASKDFAPAQVNYGGMLEHGRGVESDPQEAVKWYALAASQKDIDGLMNLARCFGDGVGIEQDVVVQRALARLAGNEPWAVKIQFEAQASQEMIAEERVFYEKWNEDPTTILDLIK